MKVVLVQLKALKDMYALASSSCVQDGQPCMPCDMASCYGCLWKGLRCRWVDWCSSDGRSMVGLLLSSNSLYILLLSGRTLADFSNNSMVQPACLVF